MYLRHSLFLLGKLNYALVFQGKDGYSLFESCPRMSDTETAHVYGRRDHFESIKILQGKKCVSGHRMSLIMTTRKSPSLTGDRVCFASCV